MPTTTFLSARELRMIAGKEGNALPDEFGETLPVPIRVESKIEILVMFSKAQGRPMQRTSLPPTFAVYMEPTVGKVLRFGKTTAAALGIKDPKADVPGVGIDPNLDPMEFDAKRERFLQISSELWAAFDLGKDPKEASQRSLAHEYWELFKQITPRDYAPFYVQAAPDFFAWVQAAQ